MTMRTTALFILMLLLAASCGDYLELKPDKKMVIPATLSDLQALLNNTGFMNQSEEAIGEMSADNYYLNSDALSSIDEWSRDTYLWGEHTTPGGAGWGNYYRIILYANQVIESVESHEGSLTDKGILKGKAYFFRGNAFYQLAQIYSVAYDKATAADRLGLPLRLSPGISDPSIRATLKETYEQILSDFHAAANYLPAWIFEEPTQPNKAAALAGLARTYLLMGDYERSLEMARASLTIHSSIIDYNELDGSKPNPIELFNDETIYFSRFGSAITLRNEICNVDTMLFQLYHQNDLRKNMLFENRKDGSVRFRGNYAGNDSQGIFNGITTAEIVLIEAESLARLNKLNEAEQALTKLLEKRYKSESELSVRFNGEEDALLRIIEERRKELLFRGARWSDLRRMNLDERFKMTLYRQVGSSVFSLLPNDNRYVFRIPDEVIEITGVEQNPR